MSMLRSVPLDHQAVESHGWTSAVCAPLPSTAPYRHTVSLHPGQPHGPFKHVQITPVRLFHPRPRSDTPCLLHPGQPHDPFKRVQVTPVRLFHPRPRSDTPCLLHPGQPHDPFKRVQITPVRLSWPSLMPESPCILSPGHRPCQSIPIGRPKGPLKARAVHARLRA